MFGVGPATRIYLAAGATDMRKGFEGLHGLVRDRLACDPLSGHVFLFANAQRNRLKLLFWMAADSGAAPNAWRRAGSGGPRPRVKKRKSRSAMKSSCCWSAASIWRRPGSAHGIA